MSPLLFFTPNFRSFGTGAEEMYFALLRARRENKKAVFLCPRELFWKFRFGILNRELFGIGSPYCISPSGSFWLGLLEWLLTAIYGPMRMLYLAWRRISRLFRRENRPFERSWTWLDIDEFSPWGNPRVARFSWEEVEKQDWRCQFEEYLPIELAPGKRRQAEHLRAQIGLPLSAWFVGLHVRESGFYKDGHTQAHRNASVRNYIDGIKVITAAGGWVVRLGDPSMTPLPPMERVIDYARSPWRRDFMDIYFLRECRFFLGCDSGVGSAAASLFQKPVVLTNVAQWMIGFSPRKGDLTILKHFFSRSRNRFLSLKELLEEPNLIPPYGAVGDYIYHENTPEEIRDVIAEFLGKSKDDPHTERQDAFNRGRMLYMRHWLEQNDISSDPQANVDEKYRIASYWDAGGALGDKFLERNWEQAAPAFAEGACGR